MRTPASTYRLQLSPEFTLEDLGKILDYLERLQVNTVYSAPFFQSMEGSMHGYDVTDPLVINRDIGSLERFREIHQLLRQRGIGWLQDIVPNHMANHPANPWIDSVLELGPHSPYYRHFDINWDYAAWKGKVMAPVLGKTLENAIADREIQLIFSEKGFSLKYFEHQLPISAKAYAFVLSKKPDDFGLWEERFSAAVEDELKWQQYKSGFVAEVQQDDFLSASLDSLLELFNSSEELMQQILELQYFKPVHWKVSEERINFRRFFTINDLICLRMEDEKVFDDYHAFILQLCREGLFSGLRIDHIDGLLDPGGYLEKLRGKVGEDFYIIIEKILEWDEALAKDWPMQGTSGYRFLAIVNNLYTASANKENFINQYQKIHPHKAYNDLVFEKKKFVLHKRMGGELQNLWDLVVDLGLWEDSKESPTEGKEALSVFLSAFPVYRIYPKTFPLSAQEQSMIDKAHEVAALKAPDLKVQLEYLKDVFSGKTKGDLGKMLYFLQRCQQFTGPLAAKGVEDTLFYNYNLLISHNEVGDSPDIFGIGIDDFHRLMKSRREDFPLAINATATHDTKRGEDARMRINVLSEIPEEWFRKVEEWHELNKNIRKSAHIPDRNEEYFIYQSLIGAMPFDGEDEAEFLKRTTEFLQKALREAKTHTFWSAPDEQYEQEVYDFVKNILSNQAFRKSFDAFTSKISFYGIFYSLGQTLIKITAPGIPDIYQGTELWDFSYVDPDNRRPVDYSLRERYLNELSAFPEAVPKEKLEAMFQGYADGKIKMFTLYRALRERKTHQQLFEQGEYMPLAVSADYGGQVVGFARRHQGHWYLVAVPTGIAALTSPETYPIGPEIWEDGYLELPADAPKAWNHVYTGESLISEGRIALKAVFASFPVALLKSQGS